MKIFNIFLSVAIIFTSIQLNPIIQKSNVECTTVWGDSRSGLLKQKKYCLNENNQIVDSMSTSNEISTNTIVSGSQPFISIMCKFAGVNVEPRNLTYFKNMYSNIKPGLDNYWREVSYNKINLIGSKAVGWFVLPHTLDYYLSTSDYLWYVSQDCIKVADNVVNFTLFKGINLIFNKEIDSYSYGGQLNMTLDGVTKPWRITWLPPMAYLDIVVVEHEMGHSFGFSHSSAYNYEYFNQWDVMSDMWSNCENSKKIVKSLIRKFIIKIN